MFIPLRPRCNSLSGCSARRRMSMSSVLSCQPHVAPRIEGDVDTCCASPGVMGSCSAYPSVVHPQLRSYRSGWLSGFDDPVFDPEALSDGHLPRVHASEAARCPYRPVSRIVSVTAIIRPFRSRSRPAACLVRTGLPTGCRGRCTSKQGGQQAEAGPRGSMAGRLR